MISKYIKAHTHKLLLFGLIAEVFIFFISYLESKGDMHMLFRIAARLSGRLSLMYFCLYLIDGITNSNLERGTLEFNTKFTLAKNFAIIHLIHWFLLITSIKLNNFELPLLRLIPGIITYLIILITPWVYKGALFPSIKLKLVENLFVGFSSLIFILTYVMRLSGKSPTATGTPPTYMLFLILVSLCIFAFIFRSKIGGASTPNSHHRDAV
jgi:hypothetical protein